MGDRRCGMCNNTNYKYIEGDTHIKFKSGFLFKINANMNSKRQNSYTALLARHSGTIILAKPIIPFTNVQ